MLAGLLHSISTWENDLVTSQGCSTSRLSQMWMSLAPVSGGYAFSTPTFRVLSSHQQAACTAFSLHAVLGMLANLMTGSHISLACLKRHHMRILCY